MKKQGLDRRELATRKMSWAKKMAQFIAHTGVTPNQISMLGVLFAFGSAVFFYMSEKTQHSIYLLLGAVFIQLRLLSNMLDGMVAVEFSKKSNLGDIYNDVPDRFEDIFILVGASVATHSSYGIELGLVAALVAVLTAYIRVLGKALGTPAYYLGPQAKQQRMFILTMGALIQYLIVVSNIQISFSFLEVALWIIILGGALTFLRRLLQITKDLNSKA